MAEYLGRFTILTNYIQMPNPPGKSHNLKKWVAALEQRIEEGEEIVDIESELHMFTPIRETMAKMLDTEAFETYNLCNTMAARISDVADLTTMHHNQKSRFQPVEGKEETKFRHALAILCLILTHNVSAKAVKKLVDPDDQVQRPNHLKHGQVL
jgi:hypothetical protein